LSLNTNFGCENTALLYSYSYALVLLCCYEVMLLYSYTDMLLCCYTVMLLYSYALMLLCCYTVIQLCSYAVIQLRSYAVMLLDLWMESSVIEGNTTAEHCSVNKLLSFQTLQNELQPMP
jgi:hypothetical protein